MFVHHKLLVHTRTKAVAVRKYFPTNVRENLFVFSDFSSTQTSVGPIERFDPHK